MFEKVWSFYSVPEASLSKCRLTLVDVSETWDNSPAVPKDLREEIRKNCFICAHCVKWTLSSSITLKGVIKLFPSKSFIEHRDLARNQHKEGVGGYLKQRTVFFRKGILLIIGVFTMVVWTEQKKIEVMIWNIIKCDTHTLLWYTRERLCKIVNVSLLNWYIFTNEYFGSSQILH